MDLTPGLKESTPDTIVEIPGHALHMIGAAIATERDVTLWLN